MNLSLIDNTPVNTVNTSPNIHTVLDLNVFASLPIWILSDIFDTIPSDVPISNNGSKKFEIVFPIKVISISKIDWTVLAVTNFPLIIINDSNNGINEYENPFKKEEYSLDKKLIHKMVQKINKNKIKKEKKTEEDKKNENIQDTFQRFESVKIFDKKIFQKKEFKNQKRGCYSSSKKSNEINTIDNFRFKSKDKSNNSEVSINIIFNEIINIKSFDSNEKNEDSKKESNKSKIISK